MAGRQLDVSVMVRLRDALTSPLAALQRRLSGFAAIGARIGAIGGLVASISFAAPIASAAEWDQALRDIAVTAGLSAHAAETFIAATGRDYERLALQVGQQSRDIAGAAGQLVAAGLDEGKVSAILPTLGRVSTASRAALTDVASTAFTLSSTLKVADDQMEAALTSLLVAAKAGNVEFKDMAKYLPSIGAAAANLGLSGREGVATLGAALEVVRMGAGDAATAANNLKNLLAKALSPDVSKNFAKFGVDIGGVMKDAAAKGIDPFEAMLAKVIKITGTSKAEIQGVFDKAKASGMTDAAALEEVRKKIVAIGGAQKISQIFGDQQAIEALLPLLAHLDEYQGIRAKALSADNSLLASDFATQMAALQKQLDRFGEIGEQAVRRVGKAFATNLPMINAGLSALLGWVASIDAAWPGLIDATLSWSGAILMLIAGLAATGPVLSIAAAGVGTLGAILGAVLTPIGLVVAALVGGAAIIVANWDEFSGFFADLWGDIRDAFEWGSRAVRAFFRGDLLAAQGAWRAFAASISRVGANLVHILAGVARHMIDQVRDAFASADWPALGRMALDAIRAGMMAGLAGWALTGQILVAALDGPMTALLGSVWTRARDGAAAAFGAFADAFRTGDWIGLGRAAVDLVLTGMRFAAGVWAVIGQWLIDQIKAVDWAGLGGELLGLIVGGIKALGAEVTDAARWMAGFLRGFEWAAVGAALIRLVIAGIKALGAEALSIGVWLKDQILAVDWLSVGVDVINRIWDGMKSIGGAIGGWFQGLLGFGADAGAGAQGAAAGSGASTKITGGLDALTNAIAAKTAAPASGSAGSPIAAAASATRAAQKTEVGGTITVQAAPGTSVVSTQSTGPVGLVPADRGRVQGRF